LELLSSLGLQVDVVPSGYAEPRVEDLSPAELAAYHAREKLAGVLERLNGGRDAVILAADTVVDIDGVALGKPRDAAEATRMLESLSGREHEVHTAFALSTPRGQAHERATTRVRFYALDPEEIGEYVAGGEPFDKAGAYGIQGRAASLVEAINGDFYTVMGLPLARVVRTLRRLGFTLPAPK
jgi:septum formation protein